MRQRPPGRPFRQHGWLPAWLTRTRILQACIFIFIIHCLGYLTAEGG